MFFVVFFVLLVGKYLCCIFMFTFIYYLLTYLVFLNLQQNRKKESQTQEQFIILFRILVRNEEFSIIFTHTRIKFCTLIPCNMFQ